MTDQQKAAAEFYLERVAIMTIDGEQPEPASIKHAYGETRRRFGREAIPQWIADQWGRAMQAVSANVVTGPQNHGS